MEDNPSNWSPDSARRFLLNEEDHTRDHSENKKEEAYHEWLNALNDTPVASIVHNIKQSEPANTKPRKKRIGRITVQQQLKKKFVKGGLNESEANEKVREIIAQRRKKCYDKNPEVQEKRRIKEESKKSKKDDRNKRRREKYALEKAAFRTQNEVAMETYRKRKPPGQGVYVKMFNYQLEKHLSHGLSKEEAEKAARLKTEQTHAMNKQYSAKYNAKKRKADIQKDNER